MRNILFILTLFLFIVSCGGQTGPAADDIRTCTVTFNSLGGSAVESKVVGEGELLTISEVPVRTGYNFDGWYKESGCSNEWNSASDKVTDDITLFAKWIAVPVYLVSFNSQGGSGVDQQIVNQGAHAVLPSNPDRSGYHFTGWYKESDCHTQWDFAVDTVNSAVTIYAKWTAISTTQIIVDHTSVAKYALIPQFYINEVKKMWFNLPGESHSSGYRKGVLFLAQLDSRFAVNVVEEGTPESYTSNHLRVSSASSYNYAKWWYGIGESGWYAAPGAIAGVKAYIDYANTHSLVISALGFGWCWDMTWGNSAGGTEDPVYKVHWAGSSDGGPQGNLRWGLDAGDQSLTGNSVCMDTYLNATQAYADYCIAQGYSTKVFFTTGPVDGYPGENGYQRQIKHDYIRSYITANSSRILFDYADILAWSDSGSENRPTWTDLYSGVHSYQMIHPDNMLDLNGTYAEDGDHIGGRGALRLGKAVWYMLARMAGWDGVTTD